MDNQQEESKNQQLSRGVAFQSLVRSDGWKFVKLYFESKIKAFTTSILIDSKPIQDYESERMKLVGLRELLGFIENDIKALEDANKKDTGTSGK
jgi:protein involved in sex pheromone biosynthesis